MSDITFQRNVMYHHTEIYKGLQDHAFIATTQILWNTCQEDCVTTQLCSYNCRLCEE